jgi:hypothetical protein
MKYTTSGAFRRVLEDRLIQISMQNGVTLARLRKLVVFDRFMARLTAFQTTPWVIRGGYALQLYMGEQIHAIKNVDLRLVTQSPAIYPALQQAASLPLEDWFSFEVMQTERQTPGVFGGVHHSIQSLLDGRVFENFHVEVGGINPLFASVDYLNTAPLLMFADMEPVHVACHPIAQQLAEKLHAYTRPHTIKESSRVKEFVDMLLLADLADQTGVTLLQALQATFAFAATHPLPGSVPPPPRDWPAAFEKMADEVGLKETELNPAYELICQFYDPLLGGGAAAQRWNHAQWKWE